jgi:hypothetical protein
MPFDSSPRILPAFSVKPGARHMGAGRREHALHAGARIGRAADDLDDAAAGIDLADAQAVGIGVLHGLDHVADDEGLQAAALSVDALDLEAEIGELR